MQSRQTSSKSPTKAGRERQDFSKLASIVKQEFAEDSREDESDSVQSSDEEEKLRKWQENIYYYTCPVFRVSLTFKSVTAHLINSNLSFCF